VGRSARFDDETEVVIAGDQERERGRFGDDDLGEMDSVARGT
jgi:hypothetical protein